MLDLHFKLVNCHYVFFLLLISFTSLFKYNVCHIDWIFSYYLLYWFSSFTSYFFFLNEIFNVFTFFLSSYDFYCFSQGILISLLPFFLCSLLLFLSGFSISSLFYFLVVFLTFFKECFNAFSFFFSWYISYSSIWSRCSISSLSSFLTVFLTIF